MSSARWRFQFGSEPAAVFKSDSEGRMTGFHYELA